MSRTTQAVMLGFDIGGTWVRGVRVSRGRITRKLKFRTPAGAVQLKARLLDAVASLSGRGWLKSAGFAAAGTVEGTVVTGSRNVAALRGFDFSELCLPCPVRVDNDARAWLSGALQAHKVRQARVLAITLGTGVGRAYAHSGRVKRIKEFEPPEAWETEYQRLRRRPELARYVGWQLRGILNRLRPSLLFIGGGVVDKRPELALRLAAELAAAYPGLAVRKAARNEWLGCLGVIKGRLRLAG